MDISLEKNIPAVVLASGSPRRRKLLSHFGFAFRVDTSNVNEQFETDKKPGEIVQTLARRKATEVAGRHPNSIILGADTIVVHRGEILEKPGSPDHAKAMLERLSSSNHRVLTGLALLRTNSDGQIIRKETFFETTKVTFGPVDKKAIEQYVNSGSPMDKAGAYGIQDDRGAFFVKGIEGDFYNVMGLPLYALNKQLKKFAPDLIL